MNILKAGERFFFDFEEEEGFLSQEEAFHLVKVLRKKPGEKIKLINGKGKEFEGEILETKEKGKKLLVKIRLLKILRCEEKPPFTLKALIPMLKGNKTEFLIEKATELGFTHLIPFYSTYSVKKPSSNFLKKAHLKVLSALKQSGRLFLPEIVAPVYLSNFLSSLSSPNILKILAYPKGEISVEDLLEQIKKTKEILILSGPEGDFSPEEKELLEKLEFKKLSLSPYILKAETASLVLMGIISSLLYNQLPLIYFHT
ncbi:MAG: 16S rRNA (uracil(1498)-N(3))-methyltransferase [Thermodesulfobacteriaceae bacterium]|nr:16S rRNA (uracil(1498)-N(3))-methyltransferase [Thermodesulfobacteriaceae bacterium]